MSVASAQTIRSIRPVAPFYGRTRAHGMTFGLSPAGYDIRIAEEIHLQSGDFKLASSMEHFDMPLQWQAIVHDKSTWARRALFVQNTVIEPGWRGHLTLELSYQGKEPLRLLAGMAIAQVVFHILDYPTDQPYEGKYQDQPGRPQEAILEGSKSQGLDI